jgi:hypothetical protein
VDSKVTDEEYFVRPAGRLMNAAVGQYGWMPPTAKLNAGRLVHPLPYPAAADDLPNRNRFATRPAVLAPRNEGGGALGPPADKAWASW